MPAQSESVLNYSDYRSFLKDQVEVRRNRAPGFSIAQWSRKLGLRSHATLVMILKGYRNPGPELVEELIRDLKLTKKEAAFFRDLVVLEKCTAGSELKSQAEHRLAQLHPKRAFLQLDARSFAAISNWHYYAIRELVDTRGFREDPAWIQFRLREKISHKEIREAIDTLLHLGLLKRDDQKRLVYRQDVESTFDVPDQGLRNFHSQILQRADRALKEVPVRDREISGSTITLKREDVPRAKAILRQALEEIVQLAGSGGDEVYQAEVALFPLTKTEGPKCVQ